MVRNIRRKEEPVREKNQVFLLKLLNNELFSVLQITIFYNFMLTETHQDALETFSFLIVKENGYLKYKL